jgi:hypothetical protein
MLRELRKAREITSHFLAIGTRNENLSTISYIYVSPHAISQNTTIFLEMKKKIHHKLPSGSVVIPKLMLISDYSATSIKHMIYIYFPQGPSSLNVLAIAMQVRPS